MNEYLANVSKSGRVTIPAEIRRRLGLRAGATVVFLVHEDGSVLVRKGGPTFTELRGIVPALPGRETVDFDDLINEAMEERAAHIVRIVEGRRQGAEEE